MRQTTVPPVRFEPAIPKSERQQCSVILPLKYSGHPSKIQCHESHLSCHLCSPSYRKLFGTVIVFRLAIRIRNLHQRHVALFDCHVTFRLKVFLCFVDLASSYNLTNNPNMCTILFKYIYLCLFSCCSHEIWET